VSADGQQGGEDPEWVLSHEGLDFRE